MENDFLKIYPEKNAYTAEAVNCMKKELFDGHKNYTTIGVDYLALKKKQ